MGTYIAKRLVLFVPTLIFVAGIIFLLESGQDKDSIYTQLVQDGVYSTDFEDDIQKQHYQLQYSLKAEEQHYNLPEFYISILPRFIPDTVYKILPVLERNNWFAIACEIQNWEKAEQLRSLIQSKQNECLANKDLSKADRKKRSGYCSKLLQCSSVEQLKEVANDIGQDAADSFLISPIQQINTFQSPSLPTFKYRLVFNGLQCRFHCFLKDFLTFNFGKSITDSRSVVLKIIDNGKITLLLNLVSLVLVIIISITLGKIAFYHHNGWKDKVIQGLTLALHSVPVFWAGTLFILLFTNDDYGIHLFPASGFGSPISPDNFFARIIDYMPYMVLPVLCMVYTHIAFYSRQIYSSLLEVSRQDFIRTAKSKGLSDQQIFKRHLFPNAVFPLITLVGSLIPALITGSVIVETLFSIPGMGNLTIKSIQSKDWNVVNAIVWISTLLSMLGILIADILYRWADPRVRMEGEQQ